VQGVLRGYDTLVNIVLDEAVEFLRGIPQCHTEEISNYFAVISSVVGLLCSPCPR